MKKLKYYTIDPATESSIVGTWKQLELKQNYFKVENNFEILESRQFPKVIPSLTTHAFKQSAKITDVLSAENLHPNIGFFISEAFKKALATFSLHNAQTYPAEPTGKRNLPNYEFLHVIYMTPELIDFENSIFYDFTTDKKIEVTEIKGIHQNPFINPEKLVVKKQVDLFRAVTTVNILVSETLKKQLEEKELTGIQFDEFKSFDIYID